ncbi:hypothetical protein Fcan01_11373 [Folsomia candida]|uniref:Uncharacterized protein n=1 Tax=Folsomia candida TaxID=158441 RepID=A0A226E9I2_FOLCA|nr:hypothetical protein Fcan01_11373 [Folsomia candida]
MEDCVACLSKLPENSFGFFKNGSTLCFNSFDPPKVWFVKVISFLQDCPPKPETSETNTLLIVLLVIASVFVALCVLFKMKFISIVTRPEPREDSEYWEILDMDALNLNNYGIDAATGLRPPSPSSSTNIKFSWNFHANLYKWKYCIFTYPQLLLHPLPQLIPPDQPKSYIPLSYRLHQPEVPISPLVPLLHPHTPPLQPTRALAPPSLTLSN